MQPAEQQIVRDGYLRLLHLYLLVQMDHKVDCFKKDCIQRVFVIHGLSFGDIHEAQDVFEYLVQFDSYRVLFRWRITTKAAAAAAAVQL